MKTEKEETMTDQQKKAVEKEIKIREKTESHSLMRSSFRLGAEEVLNNPERYGLVPFEYYKQEVKERQKANEDLRAERKENARLRSALKQIAEDKKEEYLNATDDVRLKAISILAKGALKGDENERI